MRAAGLILPLVFFALFWVFYVLPQQRRIAAHRQYIAGLGIGDEVVTTAGVYGTITELDDEIVHLAIADGVVIRIARLAIGRSAEPPSVAEMPDDHALDERDLTSSDDD
jgi:preprotein translocase subunit YajC